MIHNIMVKCLTPTTHPNDYIGKSLPNSIAVSKVMFGEFIEQAECSVAFS